MFYSVYWQPSKHNEFAAASGLNLSNYDEITNDPAWPNGYRVWEFDLSGEQYDQIDQLADAHVCITLKPAPRPPYSPTGR